MSLLRSYSKSDRVPASSRLGGIFVVNFNGQRKQAPAEQNINVISTNIVKFGRFKIFCRSIMILYSFFVKLELVQKLKILVNQVIPNLFRDLISSPLGFRSSA